MMKHCGRLSEEELTLQYKAKSDYRFREYDYTELVSFTSSSRKRLIYIAVGSVLFKFAGQTLKAKAGDLIEQTSEGLVTTNILEVPAKLINVWPLPPGFR